MQVFGQVCQEVRQIADDICRESHYLYRSNAGKRNIVELSSARGGEGGGKPLRRNTYELLGDTPSSLTSTARCVIELCRISADVRIPVGFVELTLHISQANRQHNVEAVRRGRPGRGYIPWVGTDVLQ